MRPELLLRLYPRAWRERYGEELLALVEAQRPLGLGAWLDLLRGALAAHLHPIAADRDAAWGPTTITRSAIALRLTRWMPLVAVSVAAAMVLIDFWFGRGNDWSAWFSPTMSQSLPRVRYFYFNFKAEELNDLALHLKMLALAFAAALMWAAVARRLTSRSRPL